MENGRLYLVFEYLNVDLKRYLDDHGRKNLLNGSVVKVCLCNFVSDRVLCIKCYKVYCFATVDVSFIGI